LSEETIQQLSAENRQIFHARLQPATNSTVNFQVQAPQSFQGSFKRFLKYLEDRLGRKQKNAFPLYVVLTPRRAGRDWKS